jgi:hypothetical protein
MQWNFGRVFVQAMENKRNFDETQRQFDSQQQERIREFNEQKALDTQRVGLAERGVNLSERQQEFQQGPAFLEDIRRAKESERLNALNAATYGKGVSLQESAQKFNQEQITRTQEDQNAIADYFLNERMTAENAAPGTGMFPLASQLPDRQTILMQALKNKSSILPFADAFAREKQGQAIEVSQPGEVIKYEPSFLGQLATGVHNLFMDPSGTQPQLRWSLEPKTFDTSTPAGRKAYKEFQAPLGSFGVTQVSRVPSEANPKARALQNRASILSQVGSTLRDQQQPQYTSQGAMPANADQWVDMVWSKLYQQSVAPTR